MNRFGVKYSIEVFGSSHGALVGTLIEGIHPGIAIDVKHIQ